MPREVKEWVGKTADSKVPDRVIIRVLEAHGKRCHFSGRPINPLVDAWDVDHKIALINWNPTQEAPHGNRESNLGPILRGKPHKEKTRRDVKEKSDVARKKKKHWLKRGAKTRSVPGSRDTPWKKPVGGGDAVRRNA